MTKKVIQALLGIALILIGIQLTIINVAYISFAFSLVGLVICVYSFIGVLPDKED